MDEKILIQSKKTSIKKAFIIVYSILLLALVTIFVVSLAKYSRYEKGQKAAIHILETSGYFSHDSDFYYHPYGISCLYKDVTGTDHFYNKAAGEEAGRERGRKLETYLTNELRLQGYDDYAKGSDYLYLNVLSYPNFLESSFGSVYYILMIVTIAIIFVIALPLNLICLFDKKKQLIIYDDIAVIKKGKTKKADFILKNVTNVSTIAFKGIKISGNGLDYKLRLLENNEDILSFLINAIKPIA